jgi:hypothetical protein
VVFGLKQRFPLVGTLGHEWVPERTPEGAERSGALEAKRRVVRAGSRGTIGPQRGKLDHFDSVERKEANGRPVVFLADPVRDTVRIAEYRGTTYNSTKLGMDSILTVTNHDLQKFNPTQAVEIFRDLLWAGARRVGVPLTRVHISSRVNVADGGVDARIDAGEDLVDSLGLIKSGVTAYQIKTGAFSPWQDGEIRTELFGQKDPGRDQLGVSIRSCLDENGTYVLVCYGQDLVEKERITAESNIRSYLSKCDYSDPKVEVWSQNNLIGIISRFPSVAMRVNGRGQAIFQTHRSWAQQATMEHELIVGVEQENILTGIQSELRRTDDAVHLRIAGEAGRGKTKIALEATRSEDLAPLVLYCNAEKFLDSSLMNELVREDNTYTVILVLDECDEDTRSTIWNQFKNRGNRIKLISISNEFVRTSGQTSYFELAALSVSHCSEIIQQYRIPKDRADVWAPFCSGYPRVAHVIGQNLLTNPGDVFRSPDTVNVWQRFLAGTDDPNSESVRQQERVLKYLSLFRKFGFSKTLENEARAISSLIAESDPNITRARFEEIVRYLRNRKILQGAHTLYITPKLFHIKLWADWWDEHEVGFDLQDFSDKLPPRLLEWFFEMFEYAQSSNAATRTVQRLLSVDGPFSDIDFLNSKLGSDFFFAVSKGEPEAALRCVDRTLGPLTKDQLLSFTVGRRGVVWALEYIAVWRELFARAARLLLRLGEAENERYSNNASGIFVDLFALGWGEVAPTEASPEERLPILQEALESSAPEQRSLGLKACAKALEETDHFVRTINTNFIPLSKAPKRWTPKTWGEWFDGIREVWRLLETHVPVLPKEESRRAARIFLNSAYQLGAMPALVEMVIATIRELIEKDYLDRFEVLEFLTQFLHPPKASKDMPPEVRSSWESLGDDISPRDFPSLMKRYVALDLLFDKFDEDDRYIDQAQPRIEELAEQAAKDPKLLEAELSWLTTTEAKRGFDFGYALGRVDGLQGFSLLPTLLNAQREAINNEQGSVFFLGGYFRALHQAHENSYEKVLDVLAKSDALKTAVPELTFRGGITERAATRIVEQAENGDITWGHFRLFEYGLDLLRISEKTFSRWITYLVAVDDLYASCTALNLMSLYYLHKNNIPDEERPPLPKEPTLSVLTHRTLFTTSNKRMFDQMCSWNWGRLAGNFTSLYPEEGLPIAKMILKHFGEDAPIFANLEKHPKQLLDKLANTYPDELWDIASQFLGPPIDVRAWRIKDWLHHGGIHFGNAPAHDVKSVPSQRLWDWIDQNVEERAWYAASFVPAILGQGEGSSSIARELLIRYGDRADVRENLRANFTTGTWWGRASDHFKSKKEWLVDYKSKEDHPRVLAWIEEYVEELDAEIEFSTIREEREF